MNVRCIPARQTFASSCWEPITRTAHWSLCFYYRNRRGPAVQKFVLDTRIVPKPVIGLFEFRTPKLTFNTLRIGRRSPTQSSEESTCSDLPVQGLELP